MKNDDFCKASYKAEKRGTVSLVVLKGLCLFTLRYATYMNRQGDNHDFKLVDDAIQFEQPVEDMIRYFYSIEQFFVVDFTL